MYGYGFLMVALVVAILGIGLYNAGPLLDRWSARLTRDLEQLRRSGR